MRLPVLFTILILWGIFCEAQQLNSTNQQSPKDLSPLSTGEEHELMALPELKLPPGYQYRSLPDMVDNSTQPYMREAFQQAGLCCGQAAGIGYNFTYEMDRERNLPANTNDNLYPTHFTWNWMHGGQGWYGVSYLHSFQILRHCGNVNVTDYGGSLSYGGAERWMSGYVDYHRGMANRISSIYRIDVGTPEGLEIFKHWINDHHEGAAAGGVGSFYSQYMNVTNTLPSGTPEAGKYVLTEFGGSANHAQTIVGYNDSIRWDYNNDGQYTNDIDINSDGNIDMKDWEIGGFKMVQSYGGVPGWGDQGFAYMMYKTVADDLGLGGIWNHCVHVLNVKESCDPQATMKVSLTYDQRERIKVVVGVSNDITANSPEYTLEYPIFNFQGGLQYMQGGWSNPENKTIEFGLDISPLLSDIELDQDVKFFLQVFENDPTAQGNGQINSFSVYDYTGAAIEITCPQTNVPINNNDVTTLSLTANFSFDRVHITDGMLPPASIGLPYSHQLTAAGGDEPYTLKLVKQYEENISTETFPQVIQQQLYPGNNGSGFVTKSLDFDFPYYDSLYSSVTVHVDGYLMFDEQLYPFPYFKDDMVLFRVSRHISPFMCHAMRIYPSENDGIWYEGDASSATFRWKASIDGISGTTDLNFAVKLYPSGEIKFYYGDMILDDNSKWIPGLCDGNEDDMQYASFYANDLPAANSKYQYTPYSYPEGLELSEDGILSGTVQQTINGESMSFMVTDNNFVSSMKTLSFSTTGVTISDSISSGGDGQIDFGEVVYQSVTLTNYESNPITDASISIEINDPNISMQDDYEYIGTLAVGQSVQLINAFSFQVSPDVPDEHLLEISTTVEGINKQTWDNTLLHFAYAPVVDIAEITVDDGNNGRLDPGETADIIIEIMNTGGSTASMIDCILNTSDPYLTLNNNAVLVSIIQSDSSKLLTYNLSVDDDAPIGHLASLTINMDGATGYLNELAFELRIGLTLENFETGDFSLFSWGFKGTRDWKIDEDDPFEGTYSARSGNITHQQHSSMILDVDILEDGDISFFRKVSCENDVNDNYDFLAFYIDDNEIARWDSILDWELVSFPVNSGYHRFEWRYSKDTTVSVGLDAAFIDYISLPGCLDVYPHLTYVPDEIDKGMLPDEIDVDTLSISNPGMGEIEYDIILVNETTDDGGRSIAGSYLECDAFEFYAGEDFEWNFTLFNGSDDNEWLQNLNIKVPEGLNIQMTSPFSGGSGGDMEFNGSMGNGAELNWYGEDASGWGVVLGGEYAYGSVHGFADPSFSGNALLDYTITGDIYGAEPHIISGSLELTNLGSVIPWISCNIYDGTVSGQASQDILLTYNTHGLEDGDYYCNIVIRDNFQHETIIPVHLLVDTHLGDQEATIEDVSMEIFPNPFKDKTSIILNVSEKERISIRAVSISGTTVDVIAEDVVLPAGKHSFQWEAKEEPGSGMYFIILEYGEKKLVHKVIRNE